VPRLYAFALPLAGMLAACGNGSSGSAPTGGASNDVDSGSHGGKAASVNGAGDSGAASAVADAQGPIDGSPANTMTNGDGGVPADAAGTPTDGGGGDGSPGPRDIGSCCSSQSTPGCSNPDLEVCVCGKDPSCCATAWGVQCALIVQQKYCQPTVRDCVCGTDAGQWDQTQCCSTDWTSTCDSVATLKCNAVQGCF
jgi:hypothetical protein